MNAGVLKVALTLSSEFLAQIGAVLVFDILDNGVPASFIVDQVAISRSIDDIQAQTHAVFFNDV